MDEFVIPEHQLKMDPNLVFQKLEKLGEGSYGEVYKAMHIESTHIVAIKQVAVEDDLDEIIKEINIMKQLHNEYIVSYYGNYLFENELWIIMELCGAGSVSDIMGVCKQCLTEEQIAVIVKDSLLGLEYLHSMRKIHRDIKAGNILLNNKAEGKLADFGVSGQLKDDDAKRNTVIGTPFWMAPEVIQEVGYGTRADMWSLGITCIEMAESRPPYSNIHPMRAIFMIPVRPPPTLTKPDEWSPEFNDFIASCLVKDPDKRPSATEMLKHPFIEKAMSRSSLLDLIERANEIIATKGRRFSSDSSTSESDSDDDEDGGKKGESGTMKALNKGGGDDEGDYATMIRKDDEDDDTLKRATGEGLARPSVLCNLDQKKQADVLSRLDKAALEELLVQLDQDLLTEVTQLNNSAEQKRKPLLDAIALKRQSAE